MRWRRRHPARRFPAFLFSERRALKISPLESHSLAAKLAGVPSFELTAWVLVSLRDQGANESILSITPAPEPGTEPVLLEYALASLRSVNG